MNKKCKVFMFPTSETVTRILYSKNTNTLEYNPFLKTNSSDKYQHLYITSDEEIKEGDWYIHFNTYTKESSLFKADDKFNGGNNPNIIDKRDFVYEYWNNKIIATTNTSLGWYNIGNGDPGLLIGNSFKGNGMIVKPLLPQPSQEFIRQYIEEYNKGRVIFDVDVEYDLWDKFTDVNDPNNHTTTTKKELKINPDNTINIKSIKDSWSREEVKQLCKLAFKYHCDNSRTTSLPDKWIEENL